ncbi:hypothetical protein BOSE62_30351 [Bosea sp. 62]|nr:hypothetical protein BOSE46_130183 [Bosea sp. 46]CAD5267134.1 hypothetical protein BOSE21B_111268 [Bosea sp. 21B]CAD5272037.1 hypothetical protein BOSE7B_30128 [Bosea sp. 7B]VVT55956.1 hypothetical protein BOS5A_130062 [Bosea sp. EC-HK365B]VXB84298.1 hypothetical protein BOSE29B_130113 [Bosea sp. 29B]VXC19074.1 hypothetical protein BOSE62_30351 [Bosea sp. 62]VXC23006.1 hypothetical protein BOSE125_180238 [Bosea sp. 125]VXC69502.1 hypothetical protein BOSE127_40127 [Bosea sp. 127]
MERRMPISFLKQNNCLGRSFPELSFHGSSPDSLGNTRCVIPFRVAQHPALPPKGPST